MTECKLSNIFEVFESEELRADSYKLICYHCDDKTRNPPKRFSCPKFVDMGNNQKFTCRACNKTIRCEAYEVEIDNRHGTINIFLGSGCFKVLSEEYDIVINNRGWNEIEESGPKPFRFLTKSKTLTSQGNRIIKNHYLSFQELHQLISPENYKIINLPRLARTSQIFKKIRKPNDFKDLKQDYQYLLTVIGQKRQGTKVKKDPFKVDRLAFDLFPSLPGKALAAETAYKIVSRTINKLVEVEEGQEKELRRERKNKLIEKEMEKKYDCIIREIVNNQNQIKWFKPYCGRINISNNSLNRAIAKKYSCIKVDVYDSSKLIVFVNRNINGIFLKSLKSLIM